MRVEVGKAAAARGGRPGRYSDEMGAEPTGTLGLSLPRPAAVGARRLPPVYTAIAIKADLPAHPSTEHVELQASRSQARRENAPAGWH